MTTPSAKPGVQSRALHASQVRSRQGTAKQSDNGHVAPTAWPVLPTRAKQKGDGKWVTRARPWKNCSREARVLQNPCRIVTDVKAGQCRLSHCPCGGHSFVEVGLHKIIGDCGGYGLPLLAASSGLLHAVTLRELVTLTRTTYRIDGVLFVDGAVCGCLPPTKETGL
jgi:hypothetical protein